MANGASLAGQKAAPPRTMVVALLSKTDTAMPDSESIEGKYANYFQIGNNAIEFVIDFGQLYAGETVPRLHTRIITSPFYIRELLELLQQSLEEYQAQFGPVRDA
jgi:Protein of unknown function (DUF3467)